MDFEDRVRQALRRYKERVNSEATSFVRRHKIQRPPCECCGSEKRIHMHHHYYPEPLIVAFLCAVCHLSLHRGRLDFSCTFYDLRDMIP